MRRALLMINPNCRQGRSDLSAIFARFAERGIAVERIDAVSAEQGAAELAASADRFDLIVLGGGDGTLRGSVRAVLDAGLPLGVLPLGTANDLARSLGVPADPLAAVDVIADGLVHSIDLGRVNGHYFFNAANIGMGVTVTGRLDHERKQRWGVFAYARSMLEAWREVRPFRVRLICDGRRHELSCIHLTVGNGRFYGGGMSVHEDAAIDDQQLDVYVIHPHSIWRIAPRLPAIRAGRHDRLEEVSSFRGRRIELATSRPRLITADGELVTRTPAVFEVVPAALPVYVPRGDARAEGLKHVAE